MDFPPDCAHLSSTGGEHCRGVMTESLLCAWTVHELRLVEIVLENEVFMLSFGVAFFPECALTVINRE